MLVDEVAMINKVVDLTKIYKRACLILKMDFEKVFDSISLNFLDYILVRFIFSEKWRFWMIICVFASNMVMLVHDYPTREINIQRGLKLGDPLSHFRFLPVVHWLSGIVFRE